MSEADGNRKGDNAPPHREPQLGDPDYDLAAFGRDLTGGSLRWIATALAALGTGFVVYQVCCSTDVEVAYPIHRRGRACSWTSVGALVLWGSLGIVNWVGWLRAK
jgi:hypothetical protein